MLADSLVRRAHIGSHEACDEVEFVHDMSVERLIDHGRAGKPYQDSEWAKLAAGDVVDEALNANDVRLTVGSGHLCRQPRS